MYFNRSILRSRRAILFQRFLLKLASQAHFNAMCFSFAAKMAADTNQIYVSERRRGKQVENKEWHFEEVAKGKYDLCLFHNENDGLKTFYASLHLKQLWRKPSPLDQRHIT